MKYLVLGAYILMMVLVIFFTAKKSLSLKEFFLGGHNVGPWLSALSYGTSYFSAVIIIGYAGSTGWDAGFSAVWAAIGNAMIGSLVAWLVLAKPTREMGARLQTSTMPGFFEKRYESKALKLFSAVLIFVFLLPYSASVYKGLGTMFKMAMGFDYTWCVIGIAMLSSVYLFLGGYKATVVTDMIQGFIMIVGIGFVVIYILKGAGGLREGLSALGRDEIGGAGFNTLMAPKGKGTWLLSNVMLTSLGVLGMPQMIHKFFAIKDTKSIKRATVISTGFALVIAGGAYLSGSFGRVILSKIIDPVTGESLASLVNSGQMAKDMIMPTMLIDQSVVGIPDALLGLFVVLLLSASVSTLTSLVLSSASVISIDLIGTLKPNIEPKTQALMMRILCIVFVVFSLIVNFLMQDTPIVSLMSLSWGTIAGALLSPFLYGLLWPKTTKVGAFSGAVSGMLISLLPPLLTGNFALAPFSGTAAMLAGLLIVPAVSLLTQSTLPTKALLKTAFGE